MAELKVRPYQQELLEAALEENTIVNLGTGAGKTYIAVMMIKELSPSIFTHYERSVFLVTTVNLVEQQAEYIELHTHLNVGKYCGDMGVDSWSQPKWSLEFDKNQILVMTMTIFKNLILSGFMKFSQVNLLVFDECHHAVKNHDYVQIMRRYNDYILHGEDSMRILGLTASLIPSKCRAGDLEQKIVDLEKTLCCRSQTAEDLKEVAKYATNPVEIELVYSSDTRDEDVGKLKDLLEAPVRFLESFSLKKRKSQFYDIVKLNLDDCLHILLNLGIWCAHQFAVGSLLDIVERIDSCFGCYESEWEESLINLGRTHMQMFVNDSKEILRVGGNRMHMVDKVKRLLRDPSICSGKSSQLVGIIFTERRTTAASLCSLLSHQSRTVPELSHIKCDYVVGHDAKVKTTYLRKEAKMTSKKQGGVLEKFRRGKINLLVATSVVEEGVDVPRCNTVIRFDFPQNFRSYVQSKGRARARESQYILLIPREDERRLRAELTNYNSLVKELERVCHNRHINDSYDHLMEEVEPYKNAHGATATINSSLSLVHRYCQILPKDIYTIPAPDFRTEKKAILGHSPHTHSYRVPDQEYEYQTTMTFPMSAPIKEPIEGEWFPSRKLARKSAALVAVKRLDEAGELDPHLKPKTYKDIDSDDEDEEFSGTGDGVRVGEGKKHRYYLNQTAPALVDCFPAAAVGNYLYMFYISDCSLGGLYLSFSDAEEQQHSFGILSSKPLPHLQIPEFSIYDDNKELSVKVCKYHMPVNVTDSEIKELKEAHSALFKSVLKIKPSWLQCCYEQAEKSYLVVPLCLIPYIDPMEAYIDFRMVKKLASLKSAPPRKGLMKSEDILPSVRWPVPDPQAMFRNRMVVRKYDQQTLHEVKEVSSNVILSSKLDFKSTHSTYIEYFSAKYGCTFKDDSQPALMCKQLGESEARIQMLTSRYKTHDGANVKKSESREGRVITLFPELCNIHPLPTNVWKLAHCVPSILWRVECILAVDNIRNRISSETGIGKFPDGTEVSTCINLIGYKDMGFGSLESQKLIKHRDGESEMMKTSCDPLEPPLRGPNNALLLQALTPKGASDSIDLERLETLGDSFLKFSTTVFLYGDRLTAHEGKLSIARARRISNSNLYNLARRQGVTNLILSSSFNPRTMWIPPCFRFDDKDSSLIPLPAPTVPSALTRWPKSEQEKLYMYHKASDKGVADCMEGLIGAYLVSGGILAGLKFMTCMGIKIQAKTESLPEEQLGRCGLEEGELSSSGSYVSASSDMEVESSSGSYAEIPRTKKIKIGPNELPIFVRNSAKILTSFFPPFSRRKLDRSQEVELKRLLSISFGGDSIQKTLCWKFTDRTLLLEAMTHASYTKNRLTECYQRLEFLGDAVLDYLVTSHIYSTFPNYDPGEITSMRSALVNNFTFAELAVKLNLHKALLYNSPFLYKQIELFIKSEMSYENDGTECENFMINNESGSLVSESELSSEDDSTEEEIEYLDPPKVLGDILESLAGAIFVDSGMSLEKVWKVFRPLFDKKIKSFKGEIPVGPIHELFQREPNVKMEKVIKGAKRVCVSVTVLHKGKSVCVTALASTPKAAKTAAAKAILRKIKED